MHSESWLIGFEFSPEKVETIVIACCSLHNLLRDRHGAHAVYIPTGIVDVEDEETHLAIGVKVKGHRVCVSSTDNMLTDIQIQQRNYETTYKSSLIPTRMLSPGRMT